MKLRQIMMSAALAIVALGTGATSASAEPGLPKVDVRSVTITGNFTGVLVNGLTVVYDCAATATGDAVSVAITECYLTTGMKNSRIALPGPAATVADTDRVPLANFELCFAAVATFTNADTRTVRGCTNTFTTDFTNLVGAGAATSAA